MEIDQQLIDEIVRRVLSVTTPDRIILFGSAASGRMTIDSDIDLMILEPTHRRQSSLEAHSIDSRAERAAIRRALTAPGPTAALTLIP